MVPSGHAYADDGDSLDVLFLHLESGCMIRFLHAYRTIGNREKVKEFQKSDLMSACETFGAFCSPLLHLLEIQSKSPHHSRTNSAFSSSNYKNAQKL
jgi:hypothetical protein